MIAVDSNTEDLDLTNPNKVQLQTMSVRLNGLWHLVPKEAFSDMPEFYFEVV